MAEGGCQEVVLEAEVTNGGALRLYEKLGFLRAKRLRRYYLSGSDAFRLKLQLPLSTEARAAAAAAAELEAALQLQQLGVWGETAGTGMGQQQQLLELGGDEPPPPQQQNQQASDL